METLHKKSLFWDVDNNKLSRENDWFFIIERILEFGDIDDLVWMKRNFTSEQIKETIRKSRILTQRTLSYCKASGHAS
ncbi:MAG: hypothetical protein FJ241_11995 [Nitrospira sp.]|jgi:hypothetical protein|nr:hypothetical protein [Nitrospira sp.]